MIAPVSPRIKEALPDSHFSQGTGRAASANSPRFLGQLGSNSENGSSNEPVEPAWVAGFDPELIDSLRGLVNFVD